MITSSVNRVIYKGNGSATEFPYPFKIFDRTNIKVLLIDAEGNRKVLTSDYYVEMDTMKVLYPGYAPGAEEPEADKPHILAEGETLVIYRELPITQMDQLPDNYPFSVIEQMDDRGCVIAQQLADKISRAITVGEETILEFDGALPPIEAGKALRINEEGNGWEFTEDPLVAYQKADAAKTEAKTHANSAALSAESANRAAQRAYDDGRAIIEQNVQEAQTAAENAQSSLEETTETANQVTERLNKLSNDGIFEYDADINIQPVELPVKGKYFELDDQGNFIPVNINTIVGKLISDVNNKQDRLIAGDNITIDGNNVISSVGGGTGDVTKAYVDEQNNLQSAEIQDLKDTKVDDVQINGVSVVTDKVAEIPIASSSVLGVVKYNSAYGITVDSNGFLKTYKANESNIDNRNTATRPIMPSELDYAVKQALCDGKGASWTDTEKASAWKRFAIVKTTLDEIAIAGAGYFLGNQTNVNITLPNDAEMGQEISVSWYNGNTPATLSIDGDMLDFDYTPNANTRSEINALWDGMYWAIIGNEMGVAND